MYVCVLCVLLLLRRCVAHLHTHMHSLLPDMCLLCCCSDVTSGPSRTRTRAWRCAHVHVVLVSGAVHVHGAVPVVRGCGSRACCSAACAASHACCFCACCSASRSACHASICCGDICCAWRMCGSSHVTDRHVGMTRAMTRPSREVRGTGPYERESCESDRLSPT